MRSLPPWRRHLREALPALSLAALLVAVFWLQPRTMSYVGLNLMLNLAVPIALATIAQMCVITVNELDLGIGTYVGFVACVAATWLVETPLLGVAALAGGILVYVALGALIQLRNLPSIVVTLGMSFVWLGLSVLILPTPGGKAPEWVRWLMTLKPALVPLPIIAAAVDRPARPSGADEHRLRCGAARGGRQPEGDRTRRLVLADREDGHVRVGRLVRHAGGPCADRAHHLGRRQHRPALHAALDRRRHPRRRGVHRGARLARRGGDRCHDPHPCRLASCPSCAFRPTGRSARRGRS